MTDVLNYKPHNAQNLRKFKEYKMKQIAGDSVVPDSQNLQQLNLQQLNEYKMKQIAIDVNNEKMREYLYDRYYYDPILREYIDRYPNFLDNFYDNLLPPHVTNYVLRLVRRRSIYDSDVIPLVSYRRYLTYDTNSRYDSSLSQKKEILSKIFKKITHKWIYMQPLAKLSRYFSINDEGRVFVDVKNNHKPDMILSVDTLLSMPPDERSLDINNKIKILNYIVMNILIPYKKKLKKKIKHYAQKHNIPFSRLTKNSKYKKKIIEYVVEIISMWINNKYYSQ